jgi:cobaltochelatase CobS
VSTLNYLAPEAEVAIVIARVPACANVAGRELVGRMVALAGLTRAAFMAGELSTVMSPRTVIHWAENLQIFGQVDRAFRLSFLNRCDEAERGIVTELYQRCLGVDLATESP